MFYIFISILAGVCVVVSRIINYNLAQKTGVFQGTFLNNIVGLIFSIVFFLMSNETVYISLQPIPLWGYLGGLLGIFVVALSTYITPKISAFYVTLLVFIGQLLIGIGIDYLGTGDLSIGKVIGGVLVLIGLIYNLIIDNKKPLETTSI